MQKKFLPFLILPVLALASCGGTSTPSVNNTNISANNATNPTPAATKAQDAGDQTMTADEVQLLKELNAARAVGRNCGSKYMPAAPAVTWNGYLAAAARAHATDMANRGYFAHSSPEGNNVRQRAEAAGYNGWTELGENLAAGYTLASVTKGWLDSVGHCQTLMDPKLKEVGMSYVYQPGSKFGTYWVQDFGTR